MAPRQRSIPSSRGAYVLSSDDAPDLVLMATGSEVQLVVEAAETLRSPGASVRVVSVPGMDRFLAQDASYRDQVVPPSVRQRVAVEAGRTMGWQALVGDAGAIVGIDRFGESAPASVLAEHFGFTAKAWWKRLGVWAERLHRCAVIRR